VQDVLSARIDRLPPTGKDLLQTLAVIGKEFPLALVRRVVERREDDLYDGLSQLQAAEFIYEQPAFPEPEYTFKHALTQEVAYHSLLAKRRGLLHERAAGAIEDLYCDALEAHYEELAYHYARTANTTKAIEYLYLAGEQAVQRSAYHEATSQLSKGVELIATLPETPSLARQELLLQLALGPALAVTEGFTAPEVDRAYARARDLCTEVGENPQLFQALQALFTNHHVRAELDKAHGLAMELLHLARTTKDPVHLLLSHLSMGSTTFWLGEFSKAFEHLQEGMRCHDPRHHRSPEYLWVLQDAGVSALAYLSWVLWDLGYPEQALTRSEEALGLAHELAHPFSQALALGATSRIYWLRGESTAAFTAAEALISLSDEHGFPFWVWMGAFLRASALVDQGQLQQGMAEMHAVLQGMRAAGVLMGRSWKLISLAQAQRGAGQVPEGLDLLAEALEFMAKMGVRDSEAEVHRVRGELLLARGPSGQSEAETSFRKAIDVARQQNAKSWELRAVTSLARVWQQQGRNEEARELLAPVYDWFTEGFDTRDLKDAKALLDELTS
jgi:predicted ATPase